MKKISLIAAMTKDRIIGKNNQLPWHLPADLKHFKSLTLNKTILMGRKTFESLGKPLPQRTNIVISRQPNFLAEGCLVLPSLELALQKFSTVSELMIIGGANLFEQTLPLATHLYLTFIDANIEGDAYFPLWKTNKWQKISQETHAPDKKNIYTYSFVELQKNK